MGESTRVPQGHKWCNIGLHVKPLSEFGRCSQRRDGLMGACRECVNASRRVPRRPVAPVPDGHKRCTKGGHIKPLSEFTRRPDQPGRHKSACKECVNRGHQEKYWAEQARRGRQKPPPPAPVPPGHKRCSRAGHVKPLAEFPVRSDGQGDYASACLSCENRHRRERRRTDPVVRAGKQAAEARWNAKNPTYQADYYAANRDYILRFSAAYKKLHPVDPQRQREYGRLWAKNNPEKVREKTRRSNSRRRARLAKLPFEEYTLEQILERDGIACVLCGEDLDLDAVAPAPWAPTVEHLECISWPGSAGDVFSNVGAAHSRCNCRRRNRPHPAAARKRAELLAAERAAEPA